MTLNSDFLGNKTRVALPLLFLVVFSNTFAADHILKEQFGVNAGYFYVDADTQVKLDGTKSGLDGTELNLNNDLGMDSSISTVRLDAFWRITPKHRIDFSWYDIDQSGSSSVSDTINILGFSIPVGAGLQSEIQIETFKFNYTYNFFQAENYEFGPSIGVHLLDIDTRFHPSAFVGSISAGKPLSSSITLPTPVIGMRGAYAFTEKLLIRGSFDYTNLEIGTWDAELFDVSRAALDGFAKAAAGGDPFLIPTSEIVHGAAVTEAIVKSAASGQREKV